MGVAMVGVPGRINHKDRQRTMCVVASAMWGGGDRMVAARMATRMVARMVGEDGGEGGAIKYVMNTRHDRGGGA